MENYSDNFDHRPSIGFRFGLTLLLVLLFSMTAFFLCCLHWEKIRSFLISSPDDDRDDDHHRHFNSDVEAQKAKQTEAQCLPVLMPGDEVPKFIAISCPCKPLVLNHLSMGCKPH